MFITVLLSLVLSTIVNAQYGYSPASELGSSANGTDVSTPLALSDALDLQVSGYIFEYSIISLACATVFFGIFAMLVAFSTFTLINKGLNSKANKTMLLVTVAIFASSTSYWAVSLTILIRSLRDVLINNLNLSFADKFTLANGSASRLYLAEVYLSMVNYSLSDAVVVWRAWALWPGKKWKVFFVPIALLVGSVVSALLVGGFKIRALFADTDHLEVMLNNTQIIGWSLSLGTNFVGTSLIAWKAWKHRQFIKLNYGKATGRTKVEKIFALLVESGFLYCCTQLAVVVSWFILLPHSTAWASDVFGASAVQLAGIYPTIVIILASMQRTIKDTPGIGGHGGVSFDESDSMGVGTHMSFVPAPTTTNVTSTTGTGTHGHGQRTSFIQLRLGENQIMEEKKDAQPDSLSASWQGSRSSDAGDVEKQGDDKV